MLVVSKSSEPLTHLYTANLKPATNLKLSFKLAEGFNLAGTTTAKMILLLLLPVNLKLHFKLADVLNHRFDMLAYC